MAEYLKRDIARIIKRPPRTIEFWTGSGLVVPDIEPSQGKGKTRVFSGRNLLEFGAVETMVLMGVSLEKIKHILSVLRKGNWVPRDHHTIPGENEREVRRERSCVRFDFFWTEEEWGISKELVAIFVKGISRSGAPIETEGWHVLEKRGNEGFPVFSADQVLRSIVYLGSVETIIWLGRIKRHAQRMALT